METLAELATTLTRCIIAELSQKLGEIRPMKRSRVQGSILWTIACALSQKFARTSCYRADPRRDEARKEGQVEGHTERIEGLR